MVAAELGNLEIVQELIRRGANVNFDDVVSMHTHNIPERLTRGVSSGIESTGTGEKQCGPFRRIIHLTKTT